MIRTRQIGLHLHRILNEQKMKKVLFICVFLINVVSLSAQLSQHGLVLNGGRGFVDSKVDKSGGFGDEVKYNAGLSAGYRLRFKKPAPQSFHYDIDVSFGAKWMKYNVFFDPDRYGGYCGYGDGSGYSSAYNYKGTFTPTYFTSIGGTVNFSVIKNLSAGLGLEPTYYFKREYYLPLKYHLDIPVVAKIAYNLKVVEIGITGRYGLINKTNQSLQSGGSGRIGEIQLSVFVPFQTR